MRRAGDWFQFVIQVGLLILVATGRADLTDALKECAGRPITQGPGHPATGGAGLMGLSRIP